MKPKTKNTITSRRYDRLLGERTPDQPIYDRALLEFSGCVVAPSLGSIVPNWLLLVPRLPVLNFAEWQRVSKRSVLDLLKELSSLTRIEADRVIWFEHGSAATGSIIGCGVDHAHLHILIDPPFTFDAFSKASVSRSHVEWEKLSVENAYRTIQPARSYLVAGNNRIAMTAPNACDIGSQFFRRIVAELADRPNEWNYREFPHLPNINTTVRHYRDTYQRFET